MRRITASVISIFVSLPAFADARLPVVNVGASGVSARAAFGDSVAGKPVSAVSVAPMPKAAKAAAPRQKVSTTIASRASRDSDIVYEDKVVMADVLTPRRPSSDLWAHSDAPLRMPTESEISVVRADYNLPEESLDSAPRADIVAHAAQSAVVPRASATRDMDAEIARLVELQRRADESVRKSAVAAAPVAPAENVRAAAPRPTLIASASSSRAEDAPAPAAKVADNSDAQSVKLSRMVVPMDDDVVVRTVQQTTSPKIAAVRDDMTKMSPSELRKAFRKTYLSENKHLSTYQIDDRFDVASDMTSSIEGFTAAHDLSEAGGVRPLEIKIRFRGEDSALSRDNYNLLNEYASIVVSNPKRAIQIAIPQKATTNLDARKLAARRLAIVEQVLRDTGVSEQRIVPVLSQRDEEGFVLRVISSDQYETLTQQQRNIFGDTVNKKTYKSMSW